MTVHGISDGASRLTAEPAEGRRGKQLSPRLGAFLSLAGVIVELPLAMLHPHHSAPNDSRAAFREYSTSDHWTLIHLGQYAGTLLIVVGLVILATRLAPPKGIARTFVQVSKVAAVLAAAVFAVQMAVDGIALKSTVDAWASASGGMDRVAAYHAAEAVRSVEKGLSALFHVNNAVTLMALGSAMVLTGRPWRCVGLLGVAAGIAFLAEAVVTAQTGFSDQAAAVGLAPTVLLPVFLLAAVARGGRRTTDVAS
jgi:hypothetical protein